MTIAVTLSVIALALAGYAAWATYFLNKAMEVLIDDYRQRKAYQDPHTYNKGGNHEQR